MPLWDSNSTISGELETGLFEQMATRRSTLIGQRNNAFVAFFTGLQGPGGTEEWNLGSLPMGARYNIEGKYIDVHVTMPEPVGTGTGVGAAEDAVIAADVRANKRGAARFRIMNRDFHKDVRRSTVKHLARAGKKPQLDYLVELNETIIEAEMRMLEIMMAGPITQVASESTVASVLALLRNDNFGGLDRNDVANAFLRGDTSASASVSLATIRRDKSKLKYRRAGDLVLFCDSITYGLWADKVEAVAGAQATQVKDNKIVYGGEYFQYFGINAVEVRDLPANHAILCDPTIMKPFCENGQVCVQETEWARNPAVRAGHRAFFNTAVQMVCTNPELAEVKTAWAS